MPCGNGQDLSTERLEGRKGREWMTLGTTTHQGGSRIGRQRFICGAHHTLTTTGQPVPCESLCKYTKIMDMRLRHNKTQKTKGCCCDRTDIWGSIVLPLTTLEKRGGVTLRHATCMRQCKLMGVCPHLPQREPGPQCLGSSLPLLSSKACLGCSDGLGSA